MYRKKYIRYKGHPTFSIRGYAIDKPCSPSHSEQVGSTAYNGMAMLDTWAEQIGEMQQLGRHPLYVSTCVFEGRFCLQTVSPQTATMACYCQVMQVAHLDLLPDIPPRWNSPGLKEFVAKAKIGVITPQTTKTKIDRCTHDPVPEPGLNDMRHGLDKVIREYPHNKAILPCIFLDQQPHPLGLGHIPLSSKRSDPAGSISACRVRTSLHSTQ